MENLKTNWKVNLSRCRKDCNSCQIHSHAESESLCIYGLVSVQQFYLAKYVKAVKKMAIQKQS